MKRNLIFLFLVCPIWAGLNAQVTICNQGLDEMKSTTLQQDDIWVNPFTTYSQTPNIKKVSITDKENILEVTIDNIFKSHSYSYPIAFSHYKSVSQTLYYPNEVMYAGGLITGLKYKTDFSHNILNKNITIWMGETDNKDLSDGWVAPSKLTQVYNSLVNFYAGDKMEVFIQLINPYLYTGKTLVTYIYKDDIYGYYLYHSRFYVSYYLNNPVARSMFASSLTDLDPMNPPEGNSSFVFADITLFINVTGLGSITGVVTDETSGEAIEGVEIKLADRFTTTSNSNGDFFFPHINFAEHEITLSKFGYFEKTVTVEVTGGETVIQDVTLTPRNTYTLSGKVTDTNGNELNNVIVVLTGYADYTGTSDLLGNYSISGVYEGDFIYRFAATKQGYVLHSGIENV